MSNSLSTEQIQHFQEQGYLYPLDALTTAQAADCLAKLEEMETELKTDPQKYLKIKAHLAAPWIVDLACNPAILDAVESLIGPDILLFGSSLFAKREQDDRFVSWHQDSAYYGLDPHQEITAWLALTDATPDNGCLSVLPGSHRGQDFDHDETYDPKNLLSRGQTIRGLKEEDAVEMALRAGQFSLHHERTVHGSRGNHTDQRRVGIAFFYMPAHVVSTLGRRSAMLVRGEDRHGHWDSDPVPQRVLDEDCMAYLRQIWESYQNPEVTKQAAKHA